MPQRFRFGPYRLEPEKLVLERDGRPVNLRPKLVETLVALVEAAPRVASKEELMSRVWPGVHVVESSLTRNISELRGELESGCPGQTAIETLPKRGYRFALAVEPEEEPAPGRLRASRKRLLAGAVVGAAMAALGAWLSDPAVDDPGSEPGSEHRVAEAAFRSAFAEYDAWTAEGLDAARFHFDRSIRAAPELWYGYYGSTSAQLAALLLSGKADPEAKARLLETADRAVLYGPEAAVTPAARGSALLIASWDWEGSAKEIEDAIRWNPQNAMPYERRGLWKTLQGRFDEARSDYDHALELQPDFDDCRLARAFNELCARRFESAVAGILEVLPNTRKQQVAHRLLAAAYGAMGEWAPAEQASEKAGLSQLDRLRARAWHLAVRGEVAAARTARARMDSLCRAEGASYCDTALVDASLGETDAAFSSLEQGVRERHWMLLLHNVDPRLDPLRDDPRWDRVFAAVRPSRSSP